MARKLQDGERANFDRVRHMGCALCGVRGPSYAHHIREQGRRIGHYVVIPLCRGCHQGPQGIHGDKTLLRLYKRTELQLLNETLRELFND